MGQTQGYTPPTFSTPYASTTILALTTGAQAYFAQLQGFVTGLRGVVMSVEDEVDHDMDRIRETNKVVETDPNSVVPAPAAPGELRSDGLINRALLPYLVCTPIGMDTILKNVVPADKFQIGYVDTNGVKRWAYARNITVTVKAKTYVTNYLQAIIFLEYLLAAFPNTFTYQYPLFNLPYLPDADRMVDGTIQLTTPAIAKVKRLKDDGQVYRVEQTYTSNITVVTLPPGNGQDANGAPAIPGPDGTVPGVDWNNELAVVQRINLDVWQGLVQQQDFSNWMSGAVKDPVTTTIIDTPTAKSYQDDNLPGTERPIVDE